jgi:hypothetical protein
MIGVLLFPGIALQSVGAPVGAFLGWPPGTLLGAACGMAIALAPWQKRTA